MSEQLGIGVHNNRVAHESQQRDVVARVRVAPAILETCALLDREPLGNKRLLVTVKYVAVESAGEDAIERLNLRSQCAREAQAVGDDLRDELRGRRDQPYLVTLVEMFACEGDGFGPEVGSDVALVDVLG